MPKLLKVSPHLSLRARRRNPDGAELAVDVAARGWPAIASAALLALVVAAGAGHRHSRRHAEQATCQVCG